MTLGHKDNCENLKFFKPVRTNSAKIKLTFYSSLKLYLLPLYNIG